MKEIPIWEKSNLTIEEAALQSGIGRNKLRQLTDDENCKFVLWVGNKRLIKRKKFDEFIEVAYSIQQAKIKWWRVLKDTAHAITIPKITKKQEEKRWQKEEKTEAGEC